MFTLNIHKYKERWKVKKKRKRYETDLIKGKGDSYIR